MTYGELRLLCQKANPGVDLELIDGFISDRYSDIILNGLAWKRLEGEAILQSPPSYDVGTITAIQGQAAIVGNGVGTWTGDMQGRMIRINQTEEYYQFNFVDATHAHLDRPYEGTTSSITGFTIDLQGSGYLVGDQVWITGGNGLAQGSVEQIGPLGQVLQLSLSNTGNNYAVGTGVVCSGGNGAGLFLNITSVGGSANLPYRIDQSVFVLPTEARILRAGREMHNRTRALAVITQGELNRIAPQRTTYGTPIYAAHFWDTDSDPPRMQVELYPIPSSPSSTGATLSHVIDYIYDPDILDPNATAKTLLPWMSPAALKSGVSSDCCRLPAHKDIPLSREHKAEYNLAVRNMALTNALQRGPTVLRIAEQYLGNRSSRWQRGPWRRGSNG